MGCQNRGCRGHFTTFDQPLGFPLRCQPVPALHIFFLHHKSCELGDLRAAKSARIISADEAERGSRLSGPQLWRDAKNSEREAGGRQVNPELYCFGSCSISDASRRRTTKTHKSSLTLNCIYIRRRLSSLVRLVWPWPTAVMLDKSKCWRRTR